MYDNDAADILDFQRNPYRNDYLCTHEHDLRQVQETVSSDVHSCSSVYPQVYFNLMMKIFHMVWKYSWDIPLYLQKVHRL